MNLLQLSWKNLFYRPASRVMSILLFTLGIGLVSFLLLLNHQIQSKFENNLAGIDLIVGAKGSPLQLVLSSMYHIDAPTGNITLEEAAPFFRKDHPLVASAYPLSLGDSYRGYRLVGSIPEFLDLYDVKLKEGRRFAAPFEVVVGATVARRLGIEPGDQFESTHGLMDDEMGHSHEHPLKVVGLLEPSGTVVDQLILTSPFSYWQMHGDHAHDHEEKEEKAEGEAAPNVLEQLRNADGDREITSLLLKFRGKNYQALNLGRNINENTDMQAASPAIEIHRLFALMETGEIALRALGFAIVLVSALSVFLSLYNNLRRRQYELAVMRVKGASRFQMFFLILFEGLIIAVLGAVLGLLAGHAGMYLISLQMEDQYRYAFQWDLFLIQEVWLFAGAVFIGILAAILPAIRAFRLEISKILN